MPAFRWRCVFPGGLGVDLAVRPEVVGGDEHLPEVDGEVFGAFAS